MRTILRYWPVLLLLVLASCALTDQQIEDIVGVVQNSTQSLVDTGISVVAPTADVVAPGASGGVAAIAALGVGYLLRLLLKAFQKKKAASPAPPA